jgi:hypothetical protein
MRKRDKRSGQVGQKKVESEENDADSSNETKKFIKRLEIQRKLLDNLMDLTAIQVPQIGEEEIKTLEIKTTNINKN